MKKTTLLFTAFIFFVLSNFSFGQNGVIKGFVYDNSNGEPVGFCAVQLKGTSFGAMTERNGSFVISKIPEGEYTLHINYFGYDSLVDNILIKENTIIKRYLLQPSKIFLDAVQVSGEAKRVITETRTSLISVSPKEMTKMPSIGGQPDFAQYLQVLPGVISTGDQGGQLYIRGGTPIQNMVLLDGMLVLNPFHSIGLFSVFDNDMMSNADIYTGGFGAEFGGRVSSIMNIYTRDGNRKRIAGKIDANTFGAKLLLEGPLVKLTEERNAYLSYILSAKGSYLNASSKLFYRYADTNGLPFNYLDLYGKLSIGMKNGTKINFFGFNFADQVHYKSIAKYKWNNYAVGTNFLIIPGDAPVTLEGTIAYSDYGIRLDDYFSLRQDSSSISGFTANLNISYYIERHLLNVGAELLGYRTSYSFYSTPYYKVSAVDNTSDIAIYAKFKYNFRDKLLFEPSFRVQYYGSLNVASPEPRVSMKYNLTKKIRLKLAAGLYSQNYVAATSDRDVVNLFYGFLSSPDDLPQRYNGKEVKDNLQRSQHLIAGIELDEVPYTTVNVEGYFKNFSPIVSLNRYKIYEDNEYYMDKPEMERKDFIFEKGQAYGGDITVKFEYKGIYIWAVYSLGWVTRNDGVVSYAPHFDRRHNVNLLLSYACGKRQSWQFDIRWNFGSGFPYTQNQGYYPSYLPTAGIGDDYVSANENISFFLADLNQARLPAYHRLDANIKKKIFIGERNSIELNVGVSNLYNYRNIFYVNRISNQIVYQLPLLYSFGLSWSF